MEQVRNEQTIYSAAVYCRLSKGETSRQAYKRTVVLLKNTYLYGNLIKIQRWDAAAVRSELFSIISQVQ